MTSERVDRRDGADVSRETFGPFIDLILRWNRRINLVSSYARNAIWDRHVVDSLRLVPIARRCRGTWVDMGSGGGFPAVVLAMSVPDLPITLCESDGRKAAFLRTAKRELGLVNATVITGRVDDIPDLRADVISARALAPVTRLLGLSERHRMDHTLHVFPKGSNWEREMLDADREWRYDLEKIEPTGPGEGPILLMKNVRRKEDGDEQPAYH